MDVMVQRCAGLDVHRDNVVATVRVPGSGRRRWDQQTQTFAATLVGLAALAGWLAAENALLPDTVAELAGLGISPREVALDGGFMPGPTNSALEDLAPKQVFIAGRQEPASKRTTRRLRRYRTGAEGRISHLKRRYGLDRSRLKATKAGRSG